jgi:hypothetical protein
MAGQVPGSAHLVDLVHGITGPSQVLRTRRRELPS